MASPMLQSVAMNDEEQINSSQSSISRQPGDELVARASESAISRRRYWQQTNAARRSLDIHQFPRHRSGRASILSMSAGDHRNSDDSKRHIKSANDIDANLSEGSCPSEVLPGPNLKFSTIEHDRDATDPELHRDIIDGGLEGSRSPGTRVSAFALSVLSAIGVVYGDIGTSPLYTYSSVLGGTIPTEYEILAACSMILWALAITVCLKYITIVLTASLNGEGGVYVLYQLVRPHIRHSKVLGVIAMGVAMIGVALLTADGVLTPAVSVYSAVSGLTVMIPSISTTAITIITIVILITLFLCQRWGSMKLGWLFGPVVTLWFLSIAVIGCINITKYPSVFKAFNPYYAITGLGHTWSNGQLGIWKLGDVLLAVTGAEACYADIGHFGKGPVRIGWLFLASPCLMVQYLGQAAVTLQNPALGAQSTLFFQQVSGEGLRWYMLVLATLATIFASQAMISGAFATLHQAQAVNCFPPVKVIHGTHLYGQVYMPTVNYILMVLCVACILIIDGSQLTAAYGVAVAGSFVCTTIAFTMYLIWSRGSRIYVWLPFFAFFIGYDLLFLVGALYKVPHGGWISLVMATVVFLFMLCWRIGRYYEANVSMVPYENVENIGEYVQHLTRYDGVAVFMSRQDRGIPKIMRIITNDMASLPRSCIILSLQQTHVPFVGDSERFYFGHLGHGVYRLIVCVGFAEDKSRVKEFLQLAAARYPTLASLLQKEKGLTFYTGAVKVESKPTVIPTPKTAILYIYGLQKALWPVQDHLELPQHYITVYEQCTV